MQRFLPALAVLIALTTTHAVAGDAVGVIDVQRILQDSDAGRIARGLLEKSTQRKRDQLDALKKDLESLQAKYDGQKAVMKAEAKAELEQKIIEKQMELRQALQQSQADLQTQDAELTSSILEELRPIIAKLSEERGIAIVVEKGEAGVLFAAPRLDLTDIVLKRYDDSKKKQPGK